MFRILEVQITHFLCKIYLIFFKIFFLGQYNNLLGGMSMINFQREKFKDSGIPNISFKAMYKIL